MNLNQDKISINNKRSDITFVFKTILLDRGTKAFFLVIITYIDYQKTLIEDLKVNV